MRGIVIDVGSAQLAATELAPDGGAAGTILALHAGVADRRAWDGCAPAWVRAGWRFLAYDRRGFGESRWEETAYDDVDDLLAVLDHLGVGRTVLVGNSMGGLIAIDTALAHPDRVQALVLVASAVSGRPDPTPEQTTAAELEQDAAIEAAEAEGDLDLVNRLECRYWLDGTEQPEGRVGEPARSHFLDMNGRALQAPPVGPPAERPPAWDRVAEIAVPTLVVDCGHDLRSVQAAGRHLAERIPGAERAEIPGSAHVPALDAPDVLTELVLRFLGRLSG